MSAFASEAGNVLHGVGGVRINPAERDVSQGGAHKGTLYCDVTSARVGTTTLAARSQDLNDGRSERLCIEASLTSKRLILRVKARSWVTARPADIRVHKSATVEVEIAAIAGGAAGAAEGAAAVRIAEVVAPGDRAQVPEHAVRPASPGPSSAGPKRRELAGQWWG